MALTITELVASNKGFFPYHLISAASTNSTLVKAGPAVVGMMVAGNSNASARYLKLYDKLTAPTVGTDTPVFTMLIPGNTGGAGFILPIPQGGLVFLLGLGLGLTTGAADNSTGAVGAAEVVVSLGYR